MEMHLRKSTFFHATLKIKLEDLCASIPRNLSENFEANFKEMLVS